MKTMIQIQEPVSFGCVIPFADPRPTSAATRYVDSQFEALLTERQICTYLKVSKRNLYNWRMAGLIPYLKIGRAVRFRPNDVQAALEKFTINPIR